MFCTAKMVRAADGDARNRDAAVRKISDHLPQDWHAEQVKAAVRMRGSTLSALAGANGYEASSFGRALRRPWPTVERIIAQFLGKKPQQIWPSRYDRSGSPIRSNARRARAARLRQNDKAA